MKPEFLIFLVIATLAADAAHWARAAETEAPVLSEGQTNQTKFIRLTRDSRGTPQAMETAIVRYVAPDDGSHPGLVVDLIGVIHVGEKRYYQQIERAFDSYEAVLYEAVSAADRQTASRTGAVPPPKSSAPSESVPGPEASLGGIAILQQRMKDLFQLEYQMEQINYGRANFVHADMSVKQLNETMANRGESFFGIFLRQFFKAMGEQNQGKTGVSDLEFLMALFSPDRALRMKRLMAEQFDELEAFGDDLAEAGGSAIITERNKVALNVLRREIATGRRRFAIFYGAGHMPDFETRLAQEFGLRRTSERWLTAWDLRSKAQRSLRSAPRD